MTAYISISFSNRNLVDNELNVIKETLQSFNISSLVFVDKYTFNPQQEKEMMDQAMQDIDSCDMLIAETSVKGIGIGVEAGYAKAKGKPVIYIRHKSAEHSTTVSGISNYQVIYDDMNDLAEQLTDILHKFEVENMFNR